MTSSRHWPTVTLGECERDDMLATLRLDLVRMPPLTHYEVDINTRPTVRVIDIMNACIHDNVYAYFIGATNLRQTHCTKTTGRRHVSYGVFGASPPDLRPGRLQPSRKTVD